MTEPAVAPQIRFPPLGVSMEAPNAFGVTCARSAQRCGIGATNENAAPPRAGAA